MMSKYSKIISFFYCLTAWWISFHLARCNILSFWLPHKKKLWAIISPAHSLMHPDANKPSWNAANCVSLSCFWLSRRKCIQLANLQLLWKASQLFLAISDLVWSGKLLPSPWPQGVEGWAEYQRGSKLAEMWFWSQKFSMCGAVGLRLFIMLLDWDGGLSNGTMALFWGGEQLKKDHIWMHWPLNPLWDSLKT